MTHKDTARTLARRHAGFPPAVWLVLLDGLCTDEQIRTLTHKYLRSLPNRPFPRDRAGMLSLLIPPPETPHDQIAAFVADLLRIASPAPAPLTPEAAVAALRRARSAREYAGLVWACVCGPDEAVAGAAIDDAACAVEAGRQDATESVDPDEVAAAVVRMLEPKLRPLGARDDTTRLLERIEQARNEIRGARGRIDGTLADIAKSLRDLASRPVSSNHDGLLQALPSLLARHGDTMPAWAGDLVRRLEDADRRIQTLAARTTPTPTPRAQREAWRLAHPEAPLRIALVADLENLTASAREWRGRRINFQALYDRLARSGHVVSAAAFAVQTHGQAPFLTALRHSGWEPHVRSTTTAAGRPKANWDVGLTLHVVELVPRVDVVGLATGDGDFADLLCWLREQGVETRAAAVPEDTAEKLRFAADEFIPVGEDMMIDGNDRARQGTATALNGARQAAVALVTPS